MNKIMICSNTCCFTIFHASAAYRIPVATCFQPKVLIMFLIACRVQPKYVTSYETCNFNLNM